MFARTFFGAERPARQRQDNLPVCTRVALNCDKIPGHEYASYTVDLEQAAHFRRGMTRLSGGERVPDAVGQRAVGGEFHVIRIGRRFYAQDLQGRPLKTDSSIPVAAPYWLESFL